MAESLAIDSESAEHRVYHAQLITCVAIFPTLMGLASVLTAAVMGDRDMRAFLLAHPLTAAVAPAIALLFVLAFWLMGRRRRVAVVLAAALFAWMLISALDRAGISYASAALAVAGLVLAVRA